MQYKRSPCTKEGCIFESLPYSLHAIMNYFCMKLEGAILIACEGNTGRAESYSAATDCLEHSDDESSTNEVSLCRVCSLKTPEPP